MRFRHKAIVFLILLATAFLAGYWVRQPEVPEVQAAAQRVVDSNDDCGVAQLIADLWRA